MSEGIEQEKGGGEVRQERDQSADECIGATICPLLSDLPSSSPPVRFTSV
jgi:hypothetical protein